MGHEFSGTQPDDGRLADLLRGATMADAAGADSVWTAEVWRDAFVPLTAMASVAPRTRLCTAIAQLARPLYPRPRHGPADLERGLARPHVDEARHTHARVHRMYPDHVDRNSRAARKLYRRVLPRPRLPTL